MEATQILKRLEEASQICCADGRQAQSAKKQNKLMRMKPFLSLFRKDMTSLENGADRTGLRSKQERGRRKVIEKSISMMDQFDINQEVEIVMDTEWQKPAEVKSVRGPRPSLASSKSECVSLVHPPAAERGGAETAAPPEQRSPSPPPPPVPARQSSSTSQESQNDAEIFISGEYKRFSHDLDLIEDDAPRVEATNRLDGGELLPGSIEQSLYHLSEKSYGSQDARSSFISVDSGRLSDTYAETSNSSVTSSSTGHSNRLNSNASNCSGDSGTQMSLASDYSSREKLLSTVREKESPESEQVLHQRPVPMAQTDYLCTDKENGNVVTCSLKGCLEDSKIYCCNNSSCKVANGQSAHIYEKIYGETISAGSSFRRQFSVREKQLSVCSGGQNNGENDENRDDTPPPLPPRFATIRKSYTLPHNMSAAAATRKGKDLSNFLGVDDEGPGSPTKEVAQAAAIHSLTYHTSNLSEGGGTAGKKNLVRHLGIPPDSPAGKSGLRAEGTSTTGRTSAHSRPRPATLAITKRGFQRSSSQEVPGRRRLEFHNNPVNRSLERARRSSGVVASAPSTPEVPTFSGIIPNAVLPVETATPRHRRHGSEQERPVGFRACPRSLRKWNLFSSTPHDLDCRSPSRMTTFHRGGSLRWQSNDGLVTPVSLGGRSPLMTPSETPMQSPQIFSKFSRNSISRAQLRTKAGKASVKVSSGIGNSSSMFSLNFSSPCKLKAPRGHCLQQGFRRFGARPFNSIPRSSTAEVLSSCTPEPLEEVSPDPGRQTADKVPSSDLRQFVIDAAKTLPVIPFQPTTELVEASQMKTMLSCRSLKRSCFVEGSALVGPKVTELSPLFVANSKSLENLIDEAKQELREERMARAAAAPGVENDQIYMDMTLSKSRIEDGQEQQQQHTSDYLEMDRVQKFLTNVVQGDQ